jgi:uncharacterized protein YjbJ (UPF0337 family)
LHRVRASKDGGAFSNQKLPEGKPDTGIIINDDNDNVIECGWRRHSRFPQQGSSWFASSDTRGRGDPVSAGWRKADVYKSSPGNPLGKPSARDLGVMDTLQMSGTWKEIKAKLKERYANLTDDDLVFSDGKEKELLSQLQKRLGKSSEELRRIIRDL